MSQSPGRDPFLCKRRVLSVAPPSGWSWPKRFSDESRLGRRPDLTRSMEAGLTHSRVWEYATMPVRATNRPVHWSSVVFSLKTITANTMVTTDLRLPNTVIVRDEVSLMICTSVSSRRKDKNPGNAERHTKCHKCFQFQSTCSGSHSQIRVAGRSDSVAAGDIHSTAVMAPQSPWSSTTCVVSQRSAAKSSETITKPKPLMSKSVSPYDARNMPMVMSMQVDTKVTEAGSRQVAMASTRMKSRELAFRKV
mmetsp:Transcript_49409/g.130595  ORF Transcript_49409/g.130595 Transcript_49409/m.130595 type:complete len:250 (+) Transcript_49409:49-798(+)